MSDFAINYLIVAEPYFVGLHILSLCAFGLVALGPGLAERVWD
jgi:hypothetical protein